MELQIGIAGLICFALALGHATIGLVWVLPKLPKENLAGTPFGPPSMTLAMLRVTWHIVTIFCLALGTVLTVLAWADTDTETVLLRSFAAMWLAGTVMALWVAGLGVRKLHQLLRLPVPLLFLVVAILLWKASV